MNLREQIMAEEGRRLDAYRDQAGWLTIGYGRNLDAQGISEDEALLMLDNDLKRYIGSVLARFPWTNRLDPARFAVLAGMAMNMGMGGLAGFHVLLQCAEAGDWPGAAAALRDSKYRTQLPSRAERYAVQIETGQWQALA